MTIKKYLFDPCYEVGWNYCETGHLLAPFIEFFASKIFPLPKLGIILEKGCTQVHNFLP